MARKSPKLTVSYTGLARFTLAEIWDWNAERHDPDHADAYVAFLEDQADKLGSTYDKGKAIAVRPDYRYVTIRRSSRGHGHLIIYLVTESSVEILAFLHTRQDWQGKIKRGEV
jgi:plasmid stabilization system protein ParE